MGAKGNLAKGAKAGQKKAEVKEEKTVPDVEEAPKKKAKIAAKEEEAKEESEPEEDEGSEEGSEEEDEEGESEEASEQEAEAASETAIVVSKAAPKEKSKKRRSKAHRLEEAQARADQEDEKGAPAAEEDVPKGVIYVGHIPDGFGEPQMRKYFNQFGTVLRLRLSRSKRNAASKGYAFVEFEEDAVAKIVAQTMDGYLIFGKKLVCHMVEKDKLHPKLFKGWNKQMINSCKRRRNKARKQYNERPTMEVDGERVARTTEKQVQRRSSANNKLAALLAKLEVDYDLSDFSVSRADKDPAKKGGKAVKAAGSPKIKSSSSPNLKAAGSPKLKAAAVPAKASVASIMEEAVAASEDASAVAKAKGKKRKSKGAA